MQKKEDSKGTNAFSTTSEQKANRMSDISTVEKLAEDSYESPTKQDIPPQTAEKITPTTNPVTELSKDRLLEYNVSLTYNCKDFYTSRKNLLEIIKSSAIIKNSSTTANIYHHSLHTTLLVKTESLYQVLIELDKIGTLTSENIQAEDLTELNVFNKIKKERKLTE